MGVCAHASRSGGRQRLQFGNEAAVLIEKFLGAIRAKPSLQEFEMLRVFANTREGYLVRAPKVLDFMTVDFLRSGPSLRTPQHDHWPPRSLRLTSSQPRVGLNAPNFKYARLQRDSHFLVHFMRVGSLHDVRSPPVTLEERVEFFVWDPREDCRIIDLVPI